MHREFDLTQDDFVEVILAGNAANVLLMDADNFQNYLQCKSYKYHGGYARTSPFRIETPKAGRWHLVVDLGEAAGRVQASSLIVGKQLS